MNIQKYIDLLSKQPAAHTVEQASFVDVGNRPPGITAAIVAEREKARLNNEPDPLAEPD